MINAKVKRKHRNSYKLIYTALFICTLLAYLLTNDLFYSYVCYWNDRFYANPQWNPDKRYKAGITSLISPLNGIHVRNIKSES